MMKDNKSEIISSYRSQKTRGDFFPSTYAIELTNACNINCIMCPNCHVNDESFMKVEVFHRIIQSIQEYADNILLYGIGEPLLHRDVIEFIRYARANTNAKLWLSTNGLLLRKGLARDLISSDIDYLLISVDAFQEETYNSIRRGGDFRLLKENIHQLLRLLQKRNRKKPRTYVQFIQMKQNMDEVDAFTTYWSAYDVGINVIEYRQWASKLAYIVNNDIPSNKMVPNQRKACGELWNKMVIDSKGNVILCGYDFQRDNLLGNIMDRPIEEIWHSETMIAHRRKHVNGDYCEIQLCVDCDDWTTISPRMSEPLETEKMILGKPA
jgi:spiro-SPASM protein